MKKVLATLFLVLAFPLAALGMTPTVILNGQALSFDVDPVIEKGRIMVPLRAIFEAMGATVDWDANTQTATAIKDSTTVIISIGSLSPQVNGEVIVLDAPAKIIEGRTLAPLRFVGEAFGSAVNWDSGTQTANISTNGSLIPTQQAQTIQLQSATITRVVDGDTLKVNINGKEETVRLILVDTPESVHPDAEKNTEYGKIASDYTASQLKNGQIVYLQKDVSETDRYSRLLRYVWLSQPADLEDEKEIRAKMYNAKLLLEGYAQIATFPPDVKYVDVFKKFQQEARENNKGLWAYEEKSQDNATSIAPAQTSDANGKIKGNISSSGEKIYHVPGGAYYDRTVAEEYFDTEEEAIEAGYRKSSR